ncbi:hypothetical protein U0B30_23935, partial [Escherichia coli]|nr:hypothetical protein [Escherichia coli]
ELEKISRPFTVLWMRKFVFLTRSQLCAVETDRASLSCIVMQANENNSDAFFCFTLVFPCLFAFFASESD